MSECEKGCEGSECVCHCVFQGTLVSTAAGSDYNILKDSIIPYVFLIGCCWYTQPSFKKTTHTTKTSINPNARLPDNIKMPHAYLKNHVKCMYTDSPKCAYTNNLSKITMMNNYLKNKNIAHAHKKTSKKQQHTAHTKNSVKSVIHLHGSPSRWD